MLSKGIISHELFSTLMNLELDNEKGETIEVHWS